MAAVEPKLEAALLKEEGNQFFSQGDFRHALMKYQDAIQLDSTNPVYFLNAANCHLKLSEYEEALFSANNSILLSSDTNIKALFFKANALALLLKLKEAIQECNHILETDPNNPLAKSKLTEFKGRLRTQSFLEAIHIPDILLCQAYIDRIDVSDTYDGPCVNSKEDITAEWIQRLIHHLKLKKKLPLKFALQIMLFAKSIFETQPSLVRVDFTEEERMTICGDIHGQFLDMLNIFSLHGFPDEKHKYLFNGDFVDRGPASIEVILTMLTLKVRYPDQFFMARGNHESSQVNKLYGFEKDVKKIYGEDENTFLFFQQVFNSIPLCHVIQQKLFVTHGGLPDNPKISLEEISKINRFHDPSDKFGGADSEIMHHLCWADPSPLPGITTNQRGTSIAFGPDITETFLKTNGLDMVIRSHEFQEHGYKVDHHGKCVTIFSAPNYSNSINQGAVIEVAFDGSISFHPFSAFSE